MLTSVIVRARGKYWQQDEKARKAADEEMLRKKLEARKRKKQAQVLKKQQEELSQAAQSGQNLGEEMKRKMKASAFAEMRQMVLDGKYEEAVMLLRKQHEQEVRDMRGAHSRETASTMAALPEGVNAAEAEETLDAKHKQMLANLEKQHHDELDALESGAEMPGAVEDVQRSIEQEKAERASKLKGEAEALKAKMEAELQQMEEELEEQMRKEREEFDLKRKELATRAATRRQQLEESEADALMIGGRVSSGGRAQTPGSLMQQHQEDRASHATAVKEQEQVQKRLLEEKIAARKTQKDAKMGREMSRKFRDAVMNQDLNVSLRNVKQADLTPQEQEEVRGPLWPAVATAPQS